MEIDLGERCPTCRSTMEWAPADCENSWHRRVKVSTAFKVHNSFDAREWSAYFFAVLRENPAIVIDQEFMDGWFANALMRGYDQRHWQTPEYKRQVRHALHPWWNWKHWIAMAALLLSLTGCSSSAHPPVIPNHHWHGNRTGFTLYDNDGIEAASFVSSNPSSAQACIFRPHIGCEYFEDDQKALNWIAKMYKEYANEPQ